MPVYVKMVVMNGDQLSVCAFFKSSRGVSQGVARLWDTGATVHQVGDTVSPARIHEVMDLIKVSKLRPGDVSRLRRMPRRADGVISLWSDMPVGRMSGAVGH